MDQRTLEVVLSRGFFLLGAGGFIGTLAGVGAGEPMSNLGLIPMFAWFIKGGLDMMAWDQEYLLAGGWE